MRRNKIVSLTMATSTAGVALALMLLGCNAGKGVPGAQLPATETPQAQPPATDTTQLPATPAFPTGEGGEYSPVHHVSEAEQRVLG